MPTKPQTIADPSPSIVRLYAEFEQYRDCYIKNHAPKFDILLYNPRWAFDNWHDDQKQFDQRLAELATQWWSAKGYKITLNRKDGSFIVER